jgi:hypothetical protein
MKLITELSEELEYITEAAEDGGKSYLIEGPFLMAEVGNRNGRIYPMSVMEAAVSKYEETHIKTRRALGELAHPDGPQINLDRVSHLITSLKRDGNNYVGKAKIIDTPMGKIVIGLLQANVRVGVSSRGMGSLKPGDSGLMIVQPDFKLATAADIVADPSAPDAFVKGIMEGVDWIYNASTDSWYQEKLHETKKSMKRMKMDQMESAKFSIFENFINKLSAK